MQFLLDKEDMRSTMKLGGERGIKMRIDTYPSDGLELAPAGVQTRNDGFCRC